MITKEQERRLRNWARANRECPRAKKGATLVFCESLRYYYDRQPEEDEQLPIKRSIPAAKGIDLADADLLDEAYRDKRLTNVSRNLLRLYYCCFTSPSVIEQKLSLGQKTFLMHKERAVAKFFEIVDSLEENVLNSEVLIEQLALGLTPQLPKWELCHVRKKQTRKVKAMRVFAMSSVDGYG